MKKVLVILMTLTIILIGCSKTNSDSQEISNQVTDNKVIEADSDTEEIQDAENSNETVNNNNLSEQTSSVLNEQDNDTNVEINNQYFFKDIANKKEYIYTGTIWGDYAIKADKLDKTNDEGDVYVTAKLNISEVAKLIKGKVFELEFSMYGETNNTKEYDEKAYFWVIEDKIYQLSLPEGFDTTKFVDKNGQVDYLSCAKVLEKNNQLPKDDENLIRCSNKDMNISNDKEQSTEIVIKNDICQYSFGNSRNSSYKTLEWKSGKGLTHYAYGFGAKKYGMDLKLVE